MRCGLIHVRLTSYGLSHRITVKDRGLIIGGRRVDTSVIIDPLVVVIVYGNGLTGCAFPRCQTHATGYGRGKIDIPAAVRSLAQGLRGDTFISVCGIQNQDDGQLQIVITDVGDGHVPGYGLIAATGPRCRELNVDIRREVRDGGEAAHIGLRQSQTFEAGNRIRNRELVVARLQARRDQQDAVGFRHIDCRLNRYLSCRFADDRIVGQIRYGSWIVRPGIEHVLIEYDDKGAKWQGYDTLIRRIRRDHHGCCDRVENVDLMGLTEQHTALRGG